MLIYGIMMFGKGSMWIPSFNGMMSRGITSMKFKQKHETLTKLFVGAANA